MLRVFFSIVMPLLLPTAVYLVWWRVAHRSPGASPEGSPQGETSRSIALRWVWLAAAGVLLLAVVLFVVSVNYGTSQPGTYVPPRWEDGRIIPGHIEPARNP
jgi:hypothetical protein